MAKIDITNGYGKIPISTNVKFCSPVQNARDSVKVYFELYIAQLIKIDEVSQVKLQLEVRI